jgi:uncharacterized protein DUF1399
MIQATKPVENVVQAIQALDLDPIKLKLMDAEEGQGWSREYADRMETDYKRFLTLLVKFPQETIAPTKDVDKFWHGHILDTMKYAEDCERVFGYFLHHFPYFGMRGADDAADLRAAAANMHAIYEREFGESMPASSAWCTAAKPESAWCTAAISASAWCTAAKPQSAWCTAAKPESAWCTAAISASAWCTAAKPSSVPSSAWCTVARSASAWCTAAKPVDTAIRPTLASAG